MLRPLPANIARALQYSQITPAFFVAAEFAQGTGSTFVYAWTGAGNYTVFGNAYSGIGSVLTISAIETGADGSASITARNVTIAVSGLDPILATEAQSDFLQGGSLTIAMALFDPAGNMIAVPVTIFSGQMDTASLTGDGKQSTITFSIENRLVDLQRSHERLYTPADISVDHPLDMAFSFVYDVAQVPIYFGSAPGQTNNQVNG